MGLLSPKPGLKTWLPACVHSRRIRDEDPNPFRHLNCRSLILIGLCLAALEAASSPAPAPITALIKQHCLDCHDSESHKGGLNLESTAWNPSDPAEFNRWVKVFDRVDEAEMPPKKKAQPSTSMRSAFLKTLGNELIRIDLQNTAAEGRATQRRLNRYEYENALRELLQTPWLQIRDSLPEDGEASRFNKLGTALDVSHVQMARYLSTADEALRQTMAPQAERPRTETRRYYARDQRSFTGPMKFSVFNTAPERATFPTLGFSGQPEVRAEKAPMTVGETNATLREMEGVGMVASSYEPLEPKFNQFKAPVSGHYRLKINAHSVWVGPGKSNQWFIPNLDVVSKGRRSEPVTVYSETPPRLLRWLGKFDVSPDRDVHTLDVWLLAGETIRPDPARLFRSRPGASRWQNPLAEKDGQPGVVFRWLEVEGPLFDTWPPAGHQLLFADLPMSDRATAPGSKSATTPDGRPRFVPPPGVVVQSQKPLKDAERLLTRFLKSAYRRPVAKSETQRFLTVVEKALKSQSSFTDSMIAAYTAVLASPEFVCLKESPGRLDDHAIASRLSFFLWNSPPDVALRAEADAGRLKRPEVLRTQVNRLIDDPRSQRFVNAFLDYWLDLRKMSLTAPDSELYPDYYLDDLLAESALEETQTFFSELLRSNLPSRNIVASDFAMLNERLAAHYGLPPVDGVGLRRVRIPGSSPRGGLMTQASVLKVTANGTTTSPVVRGAWIMERVLGKPPPPPPKNVPAIDPDIRGAATIRQQLAQHRNQESCATCHTKIDPAGFALENFDVMGGWRDRYRAQGGKKPDKGLGKNGQKFAFHSALPVDASGELPDGRAFHDIRELKQMLAADERQIARNLARQMTLYATGSPIHFADRAAIERILDLTEADHFGVRSLVQAIVASELFLNK